MTAPKQSLAASARSGLLWNGGYKVCHGLVQFALMIVLVRLLAPADYGIYAVVISIVAFLNAVSFENFIGYTIQVRSDDEVHFQDHFTAAVALQTAIFLATNVLAIALLFVPSYAEVAGYIHVLSPVILLSCVGGFRVKMLERTLDWRRLRVLSAFGLIGSATTAVALALAGAGVYALLISPYLKYLPFIVDLFVVARWRPDWTWSREKYRPAWRFGLNRTASMLVVKGRALLESNLLALLAGLAVLGYFGRAIGLARLACSQFSTIVLQSVYPVLTKLEPGSHEYRRASRVLLCGIGWTLIPATMLLGLLADPLVRLLYGERWLEVIPLLPWAMLLGVITAIAHCGYFLALANQQQRHCLRYDVWGVAGTAGSLGLLLVKHDIRIYLIGLIAVELVGLIALFCCMVRARAVDVSAIRNAIYQPVVGVALAFAVTEGLRGISQMSLEGPILLLVYGPVFSVVYLTSMRLFFARHFLELVGRMPAGRYVRRILFFRPEVIRWQPESARPDIAA